MKGGLLEQAPRQVDSLMNELFDDDDMPTLAVDQRQLEMESDAEESVLLVPDTLRPGENKEMARMIADIDQQMSTPVRDTHPGPVQTNRGGSAVTGAPENEQPSNPAPPWSQAAPSVAATPKRQEKPKKRSKAPLIILGVVLVVLVLGGGGVVGVLFLDDIMESVNPAPEPPAPPTPPQQPTPMVPATTAPASAPELAATTPASAPEPATAAPQPTPTPEPTSPPPETAPAATPTAPPASASDDLGQALASLDDEIRECTSHERGYHPRSLTVNVLRNRDDSVRLGAIRPPTPPRVAGCIGRHIDTLRWTDPEMRRVTHTFTFY